MIIWKFILFLTPLFLNIYASSPGSYNSNRTLIIIDTIPPGPPFQNNPLQGPAQSCIGDSSIYTIDVPVSCSCEWKLGNQIQGSDSGRLVVVWQQAGLQVVSAYFVCDGITYFQSSLDVIVNAQPGQPLEIIGDTSVCRYTWHTYTTTVGPYDSCQWKVNGTIQPGINPFLIYSFGDAGDYIIEATAYNNCGFSVPRLLDVIVTGNAPEPPEPIGGPAESCIGNTDTYTTVVGPGETCEWRINNVLQPSTTSMVVVTWQDPGWKNIEVRAVSGCGSGNPATLNVNVQYIPSVNLGYDTTIMQGQSILLDAGNPGCHYIWSTGDTTRTILVTVAGTYSVTVYSYCGSSTDDIEIQVYVGLPGAIDDPGSMIRVQNGQLFIECPGLKISEIGVFTFQGQIIRKGSMEGPIPLPGPGIYIVRILMEGGSYTRKILAL